MHHNCPRAVIQETDERVGCTVTFQCHVFRCAPSRPAVPPKKQNDGAHAVATGRPLPLPQHHRTSLDASNTLPSYRAAAHPPRPKPCAAVLPRRRTPSSTQTLTAVLPHRRTPSSTQTLRCRPRSCPCICSHRRAPSPQRKVSFASRALTSRFRLTPSSAALIASAR